MPMIGPRMLFGLKLLVLALNLMSILSACSTTSGESHELVIQLRTDLVTGEEFDRASIFISGVDENGSFGKRVERELGRESFLPKATLAELGGIPSGSYRIDIELRDSRLGRPVATHPVLIDLRESLSITVPIDRSCLNVACPPVDDPETPEDESERIACLGGQCVDARCTLETPEFCGDDILCGADSDCQPEASCATGECVLGVCWARAKAAGEAGACNEETEWCQPETQCFAEGEDPPEVPTCFDGLQNGFETGVDCGFPCEPCEGQLEFEASDQCIDGVQNGLEQGVDCGGGCTPCPSGYDCSSQSSLPVSECLALATLYEQTGGATSWTQADGWLEGEDPCAWQGVTCSAGHVQTLDLSSGGLAGVLPRAIANLRQLAALGLGENSLTGGLPEAIGKVTALRVLNLSNSSLGGTLPSSFENLVNLEEVYLRENGLFGTLPERLGELKSLRVFSAQRNDFTGSLPENLGNLKELEIFQVGESRLSGTLPESLGAMASIRVLELPNNELEGTVPPSLGEQTSLNILRLHSNALTGTLPGDWSASVRLASFQADNNGFTGSIPASLAGIPSLSSLWLHGNNLSGPLPANLVDRIPFANIELQDNGCFTTADSTLRSYLDSANPNWDSGCP